MGVRGLSTWVQENKNSLAKPVNLADEAKTAKQTLTLLVDGTGFIFWIGDKLHRAMSDDLDYGLGSLLGGNYTHLHHLVKDFVSSFKSLGMELHFVFDPVSEALLYARSSNNMIRCRSIVKLLF